MKCNTNMHIKCVGECAHKLSAVFAMSFYTFLNTNQYKAKSIDAALLTVFLIAMNIFNIPVTNGASYYEVKYETLCDLKCVTTFSNPSTQALLKMPEQYISTRCLSSYS